MSITRTCPVCHSEFNVKSDGSRRKYCSDHCKMEAFKQRKQLDDNSPKYSDVKDRERKPALYSKKLIAQELEIRKYEIELNYKLKMAEIEEKLKNQALKQEELAAVKIKEDEEKRQKLLDAAEAQRWAPIKAAILDVLSEVIENGIDTIMDVEDLQELIEEIQNVMNNLRDYQIQKSDYNTDNKLNKSLYTLYRELRSIIRDKNSYESETEVIIDFSKSYIKELKNIQKQLINC